MPVDVAELQSIKHLAVVPSAGLADLARSIRDGTPHRQSAELGFHVHEVMERIAEASSADATVRVVSRCERPAAVPQGARPELS